MKKRITFEIDTHNNDNEMLKEFREELLYLLNDTWDIYTITDFNIENNGGE